MVASRNDPPAARGTRQPGAAAASTAELDIVALGARGDGIGRLGTRTVYVPLAAPGDRLRVRLAGPRGDGWAAAVLAVLEASPQRQAPPCPHFGDCGGCAVQHVAPPAYAAWKRALVEAALAHRGIRDAEVLDAVRVPARSRRRVTLAALHHGGAVRLGFSARASHRIVDVHDCMVAAPGITALLGPLRAALAAVLEPGERAEVMMTLADTGADVLLVGRRAPGRAGREALAALAAGQDLARLSWSPPGGEPEPVAGRRAAIVSFAGVPVEPPPGAFLQPTTAG
ncbi:MAG: class I SAM-dependent RNA methyltransferase, partial [Rhodospirillaceae bacterium]|nr:class I SAM-dependent RNA methyltransferase [Rhodospirillaceae bacterium]